ncbi:PepSY domain-containing protein [Plasticicumulans acidivorans]|uniref:Peptidase YpeB-like protein n=1 Tax=Plasticicumulans acidivorans TaxID=886464 RepID=A0A317MYF7_9GAMM|nr:PepSY domain-containing protein [Plasticicumulans acidivorans]PWV60551.1 peptidase YpeB-like protein [Plasticicumulans acidivorans]
MRTLNALLAAALLATAGSAFAADMTKEEAIAKAQEIHPGEVVKAYTETQHGQKLWEVQIKGADGKKVALFFNVATGEQDLKAK